MATPRSKTLPLAWRIAITVFLINALYVTTWIGNPMSKSILDLTVSLVDRGSLDIKPYAGNSTDTSVRNGHYYSGMPPGLSFVCVPWYLAAKTWLWKVATPKRELDVDKKFFLAKASWKPSQKHLTIVLLNLFICVFGCSVMAGVMAVWFHAALGLLYPTLAARRRLVTTWLFSFATLWFIYSPGIYHRTFSTFLCFGAFLLLLRPSDRRPRGALRGLLFGGALGLAVTCSYEMIIVVIILLAYAALTQGRIWPWAWTIGGGAVFAVLLAAYHTVCFGAPWATPYGFRLPDSVVPPMFQTEKGNLMTPVRRLGEALVGTRYGIFFYSPLLLLALPGLREIRRNSSIRKPVILAFTITLSLILFHIFTGYNGLPGEYGFRMMVPAIPFLMLLVPLTYEWTWRRIVPLLTTLSAIVLSKGVMYGVHAGRPFFGDWAEYFGNYGFSNYTLANLKDHVMPDLAPWQISFVHITAVALLALFILSFIWNVNPSIKWRPDNPKNA